MHGHSTSGSAIVTLGIGEFGNAWSYVDEAGNEVAASETCIYLVKDLDQRV